MDGEALYNSYRINVDSVNIDGTFTFNKDVFQLIQIKKDNYEELLERDAMARHLYFNGESNVLVPVKNTQGQLRTQYDNGLFVLLVSTPERSGNVSLGTKLAEFHLRGKSFSREVNETLRFQNWKEMWERRLEQIEVLWRDKCFNGPQNDFEKLFVEYFPYYQGLAENALQYLNDSEENTIAKENDFGTICYDRFSVCRFSSEKNPFDWVYDHPMRDIAEFIRHTFWDEPQTCRAQIHPVMVDYLKHLPISKMSAELLVSRLLLPLNFFETAEKYFIGGSDSTRNSMLEKMEREIKLSEYYEDLVLSVFDVSSIPEMYKIIRLPEWLLKGI